MKSDTSPARSKEFLTGFGDEKFRELLVDRLSKATAVNIACVMNDIPIFGGGRQIIAAGVARSQGLSGKDITSWIRDSSMVHLYNDASDLEISVAEKMGQNMVSSLKSGDSIKDLPESSTFRA